MDGGFFGLKFTGISLDAEVIDSLEESFNKLVHLDNMEGNNKVLD